MVVVQEVCVVAIVVYLEVLGTGNESIGDGSTGNDIISDSSAGDDNR